MEEKCSHGTPLFTKEARCIDCEIAWERMSIDRAKLSIAKAENLISELEREKKEKFVA